MFLTKEELDLTEEYLRQGYIIRPVADREALDWIRKKFVSLSTNPQQPSQYTERLD